MAPRGPRTISQRKTGKLRFCPGVCIVHHLSAQDWGHVVKICKFLAVLVVVPVSSGTLGVGQLKREVSYNGSSWKAINASDD